MKFLKDCASDAGLHIIAAVALLFYLAQGAATSGELHGSSKLITCPTCRAHHYPERSHTCPARWDVARAAP